LDTLLIPAAQLGGSIFITVIFLRYLAKRDRDLALSATRAMKAQIILAKALQQLTDVVNESNTIIDRNKRAVQDNTVTINKYTEVVAKSTNGETI